MAGFAECYRAHCVRLQVEANNAMVLRVTHKMMAGQTAGGDRVLDLSREPHLFTSPITGKPVVFDLRPVGAALRFNGFFRGFTLTNQTRHKNPIGDISAAFTHTNMIHTLCFAGLNASSGWEALSVSVCANRDTAVKSITSLDLSGNQLKSSGLIALLPALALLPLRVLDLSRCDITPKGFISLFPSLSNTLVALNVSYNQIGTKGSAALGEWLKAQEAGESQLLTLLLSHTAFHLPALGGGLQRRTVPLSVLDIAHSKISPQAAKSLEQSLSTTLTITDLDLSGCVGSTESVCSVIGGFTHNTNLETTLLNLTNISLEKKSAPALATALRGSHSLHSLILDDVLLGRAGVQEVVRVLKGVTSLRRLQISRILTANKPAFDVLSELHSLLCESKIEAFHIAADEKHALGPELMTLLPFLSVNRHLTELDISGQMIGQMSSSNPAFTNASAVACLCEHFSRNSSITSLNIDGNFGSAEDFSLFANAMTSQDELINLTYPVKDIEKMKGIAKSSKQKQTVVSTVEVALTQVRDILRRNRSTHMYSAPQPPRHLSPLGSSSDFDIPPPPDYDPAFSDDFELPPPPEFIAPADAAIAREANRMTLDVSKLSAAVSQLYSPVVQGTASQEKARHVIGARATMNPAALTAAIESMYAEADSPDIA
eukprot:TRINITY_DN3077_c1_g1_i2.p1 TRINITY_DN3077_c1_g1~~TRINITY_DN3077_c1_g1_i2.p1  ORF type:complete len:659 (-),score=178.89 TRINITY_DN3077_c1_g1_i2:8-1984(-)